MRRSRVWEGWDGLDSAFFAPDEPRAPRRPQPLRWSRSGTLKPARRAALFIFLCLVLPLGLILAFATPPGGVADEAAHALRAYSLGHGEIFGYRAAIRLPDGSTREAAGVTADLGLLDAMAVRGAGQTVTAADLAAARHAQWDGHAGFAEITPIALYMPVFYLPAAIAMRVTQWLTGGPAAALLAGRLINLLAYALLGFAALRCARSGHGLLLCTLAMPMELSLAASLNQDGLLVATATLAMALLTRADGLAPWRGAAAPPFPSSWLLAALLLGLVALVKLPYASLLLLLVLPLEARRVCLARFGVACLAGLPALCWTAYAMRHISLPWPPLPPYHPGPLWPGAPALLFNAPDAGAQLEVLRAAPGRVLSLTLDSIVTDHGLPLQLIGVLGFLSVRLPLWLYGLWSLALAGALLADRAHPLLPPERLRARDAAVVLFALLAAVIAIYMSQYLTWTRVGGTKVEGPSGRYFLPLLPALILLCPCITTSRHWAAWRNAGFLLITGAAVGSLIAVPLSLLDGLYTP